MAFKTSSNALENFIYLLLLIMIMEGIHMGDASVLLFAGAGSALMMLIRFIWRDKNGRNNIDNNG